MIATLVAFMISITVGNISDISRPTPTATVISSSFAPLKRARSSSSRTKARITRMPLICSRMMRLMASIRVCIERKSGRIRLMVKARTATSSGTTTSRSPESFTSSRRAMITPPTTMTGAAIIMVRLSSTTIWTCCTSLVVRVISVGAPNRPTSRAEKVWTWSNTAARTSRPSAIATRAPTKTAAIAQTTWSSVTASIQPPTRRMVSVSPWVTPSSMRSAFRLGR